jgi:hypothetical protein
MQNIEIARGSAWNAAQIRQFLDSSVTPIRLALETGGGLTIVPLWFIRDDAALWCASHRNSAIVRALAEPRHAAFDVSSNDIPYRGVRGRAGIRIRPELGGAILARLIERYLGSNTGALARWLLSRSADEVALEIQPSTMTAWDFSARMADIGPGQR